MDLDRLVAASRALYKERFGSDPHVVASAPGRINLIGEHTDYNSGLAIPAAIDRWILAAVGPRDDDRFAVHSAEYGSTVSWRSGESPTAADPMTPTDDWLRLIAGIVEVFSRRTGLDRGFQASISGNVPPGAGLSSSAALEVAMLNALRGLCAVDVDDLDLVRDAQCAERAHAGVASGLMDQYTSQFSLAGSWMLVDFDGPTHRYVEADLQGWSWILLDTGVRRALAKTAYGERVAETARALDLIAKAEPGVRGFREVAEAHIDHLQSARLRRRIRHYVSENARVVAAVGALSRTDPAALGALLLESHASLRDDYEVSCDELDCLVRSAAGFEGCAGARMLGGGFGGSTINLVETNEAEHFLGVVGESFKGEFGAAPAATTFALVGGARVH